MFYDPRSVQLLKQDNRWQSTGLSQDAVSSSRCQIPGPGVEATWTQPSPDDGTRRRDGSVVCRVCFQQFVAEPNLLFHIQQTHSTTPKPYECSTCHKRFASSTYLSQHSRIHLGIKPYTCPLCDRRFTQLCHLQQHIRTHTGEKPYKCAHPGCGKAFSQLSNLQSHRRTHTSGCRPTKTGATTDNHDPQARN